MHRMALDIAGVLIGSIPGRSAKGTMRSIFVSDSGAGAVWAKLDETAARPNRAADTVRLRNLGPLMMSSP
jgi:hypothetical protein